MRLLSLAFKNYRNLAAHRIEPHPRFNVMVGDNAQGKTNLLEAIYLLAVLKSFRTSKHTEVICFDEEKATLIGELERQGAERTIRIEVGRRNRRVWVNDQSIRRLSNYIGHCQVVLFAPEDVSMLKGSPSNRRKFIDRAVFNSRASYLADLDKYQEVLKQRNALLRDERPQIDVLEVFDDQLAELGARVISARIEFLKAFQPFFINAFESIFGNNHHSDYHYEASWRDTPLSMDDPLPDLGGLQNELLEGFKQRRRDELRRGQTLLGPHRDDLCVMLDHIPVKTHASQGQHRAFVLALKISEIKMLSERFGIEPLLLLDDVSSELDRQRNRQLFDFLNSFSGQVFLTTTSLDYILLDTPFDAWTVRSGSITRQERP